MSRARPGLIVLGLLIFASPTARASDEAEARRLDAEYRQAVRPIVERYCGKCHSGEEPEADVDLRRFATLDDARRGASTWQRVARALDEGEMPPKDARQPKPEERRALRAWAGGLLKFEAKARAGDPGRVVIRRLNNVEYTNTVRDLTGVDLQPAREFPADGAAGEGFSNSGDALAMSPALLAKYLDAAKEVASHAVLLPDGLRFSPGATRRDWTDEILASLRRFHARYAGADGRLPLDAYLAATIERRRAMSGGKPRTMASEGNLSPKYLRILDDFFDSGPSGGAGLLDALRDRWRKAGPGDAPALAEEVRRWQAAVWRFNNVGHFKPWQEPADPVVASRDFRQKVTPRPDADEVVIHLMTGTAGDGDAGDVATWRRPRFEAPGLPPLLLRDARAVGDYLAGRRTRVLGATARYLAAASEAPAGADAAGIAGLARRHDLDADALTAWLDYLGIASSGTVTIEGYLTQPLGKPGDAIRGWGPAETPNLVANSSDKEMRVPGLVRPHHVTVHPSPSLKVAVGWRSPIAARMDVSATVIDADPNCGNGVTWSLEFRRGGDRRRLAEGVIDSGKEARVGPIPGVDLRPGDIVSLLVGPRDGNHGCDLTEVDLTIAAPGDDSRTWSLARDVADDVHAGNPHADRRGHLNVWHFSTEPTSGKAAKPVIPPGSLLARWRDAKDSAEKRRLADDLQKLVTAPPTGDRPDAALARQVASLAGPIFGRIAEAARADPASLGIKPLASFGKRPDGAAIDGADLGVRAPSTVEFRVPAELVAGQEFAASATLDPSSGADGSVQFAVSDGPSGDLTRLMPGLPIVASGAGRRRFEADLNELRRVFPATVWYGPIVPVDEVITIVLFHREDEPLVRLVLDDRERAELDRLWDELRFVSQDALKVYQSFDLMLGFASQEGDASRLAPQQKLAASQAEAFNRRMIESEPKQINALLRLASRAYRRPLTLDEDEELRGLYRRLRHETLSHDEAFRLTLARVLVAPAFLYRVEKPGPGTGPSPVSDGELASRLSYFLWASMPDDELRRLAGSGRLRDPDVLAAEASRLVRDDRARSLATEFACQWLEIRDFDRLDEKSERHFPTFASVRADLHEQAVRTFADLFRRDGSVLELIDADHAFLNENLARHYGVPRVTGPEWRRVEGVRKYGLGGVLGLGATLAKHSGASRTSPILRGNWVVETLLGEHLPKPPKGVPTLPEDETATEGLTVRQLVEKHRADPACAGCHARIDAFGFALEGYDAIGRPRTKDLGDRPIDARATLRDGTAIDGAAGLRDYLATSRRDDFVRNFCRKLLGYALGRSVALSDEPLIDEMLTKLRANDYKFSAALDTIVKSRPFREHRGLDESDDR